MPKIFFEPIGTAVDESSVSYKDNYEAMLELSNELCLKKEKVAEGWGKKYTERVHAKNKLTAHERLHLLADDAQETLFIGTFVNDDELFADDLEKKTSPGAGVITAFVKVAGRWIVVIANDNTVASGSWWPKTPEKIIRAQEIALKLCLPVVYLVDCSGLFLPEQGRSFPGKMGAGKIFKMNSLLNSKGVPQIAGVCGDCIAGGGYMPIISDKVFMTEKSYMVIAGAALIQGAKSQELSSQDIGGPSIHVHLSNCADERVENDTLLIKKIREELIKLPTSAVDYYRGLNKAKEANYQASELLGLIPKNPSQSYDVREVIARLVDQSLFFEFEEENGLEVICGLARVSGLVIGIVANVQGLLEHPSQKNHKRPGGILYREGVAKLSRFVRALNDDGIPFVWLQDVSGFDVGIEAEKQGLLAYGSSLIYANSTHNTPMMTVLLRKASGAGYYAMAGMPYDPVLQISTPIARLAVMEGKTLARGTFHARRHDESAQEKIKASMQLIEKKIEADMNPYKSAAQMDTDEVVAVSDLRKYLLWFSESSYQSIGYRRIKNPRMWSIFDHLVKD